MSITKTIRELLGDLESEGFTTKVVKDHRHIHLLVTRISNGKSGIVIASKGQHQDWRASRNIIKQAYQRTE